MASITEYIPVGIDNAISERELAARINGSTRLVRQRVYNARLAGDVICSTCTRPSGYYRPADPSEAEPYLKEQHARLRSLKKSIRSCEKYAKEVCK